MHKAISRPTMDLSMKPDFLKRGSDGQIYSIHAPGLSLFVAPGFALFGYAGVLVELLMLSAAASALLWLIAWRVTRSAAASWFGWAVLSRCRCRSFPRVASVSPMVSARC